MNNQLEKLQQKPIVRPFRPVTIQIDKRNKLNVELDKNAARERVITQKIVDKTNTNIDRNELLKRFNLSKIQPQPQQKQTQKVEVSQVIEKKSNDDLRKEIETNDKLLTDVREIIETSNVIRSSLEDLEKEG
jgi:hypothetical protein